MDRTIIEFATWIKENNYQGRVENDLNELCREWIKHTKKFYDMAREDESFKNEIKNMAKALI